MGIRNEPHVPFLTHGMGFPEDPSWRRLSPGGNLTVSRTVLGRRQRPGAPGSRGHAGTLGGTRLSGEKRQIGGCWGSFVFLTKGIQKSLGIPYLPFFSGGARLGPPPGVHLHRGEALHHLLLRGPRPGPKRCWPGWRTLGRPRSRNPVRWVLPRPVSGDLQKEAFAC